MNATVSTPKVVFQVASLSRLKRLFEALFVIAGTVVFSGFAIWTGKAVSVHILLETKIWDAIFCTASALLAIGGARAALLMAVEVYRVEVSSTCVKFSYYYRPPAMAPRTAAVRVWRNLRVFRCDGEFGSRQVSLLRFDRFRYITIGEDMIDKEELVADLSSDANIERESNAPKLV
jgi:hypothetical protein